MKVRTEAKRQQIVEVARRIFLERGFEATSMSELAREVGGSKATLYGYFPSKEALFIAATETEGARTLKALVNAFEAQTFASSREQLLQIGTAFVAFWCLPDTIAAHRMVLAEAGRSDIGSMFYESGPKAGVTHLASILSKLMERGELRNAEPTIAAAHFMALLRTETEQRYFERESPPLLPAEIAAIAERAVDVMLRGYKADEEGTSTARNQQAVGLRHPK